MSTLKVLVGPSDHVQGDAGAACTLVEYGDYECPHCGHAYPIVKQIQKHLGKRLRFVFRNFPLNESHPHAESARRQPSSPALMGKFWEMHDLLFENQDRLSSELYLGLAQELELAPTELRLALEERKYRTKVHSGFLPAEPAVASMARPPSSSMANAMTGHSSMKTCSKLSKKPLPRRECGPYHNVAEPQSNDRSSFSLDEERAGSHGQ